MAAEKTAYHVFRETRREDGTTSYEPLDANVQAHSPAAALRQTVKETGSYVAVPARSFVPTKVTLQTQTVVKLGEAA
jgi:hypothetical protein